MGKITRISIAVPIDWECQSRDAAGQFPCPNGVPSMCRYYKHDEVYDACVVSYCQSINPDDSCCAYFNTWLGNVPYSTTQGANPSVTDAVGHNGEIPTQPEQKKMSHCTLALALT